MLEAAVSRAIVTTGYSAFTQYNYAASLDHGHAVVQVSDDLEGSVHAGGFDEGFHEGFTIMGPGC